MSEFTYSNEGVVHNLRIIGFCGVYNGSSGNPHLNISFTLIRTSRIFRKSCAGIYNALLFNLLPTELVVSNVLRRIKISTLSRVFLRRTEQHSFLVRSLKVTEIVEFIRTVMCPMEGMSIHYHSKRVVHSRILLNERDSLEWTWVTRERERELPMRLT